jgi:hypothetical protein
MFFELFTISSLPLPEVVDVLKPLPLGIEGECSITVPPLLAHYGLRSLAKFLKSYHEIFFSKSV